MKHVRLKLLASCAMILMLGACAAPFRTSGGVVMLSGLKPATPAPVETVQLFVTPPNTSYKKIALVTSSVPVSGNYGIAQAEAAALEELKKQAASAGADGVIEITREVLSGDTLISTSGWGGTPFIAAPMTDAQLLALRTRPTQQTTSITSYYTINFRAQAIKLESRQP